MRIFLTGAAGYVGSMVIGPLLDAGHDILAYDALVFGDESLKSFLGQGKFRFERGDIRDTYRIAQLFEEFKPEVVLHLAAIVGAPECDADIPLTEEVNYNATCRLADLAVKNGIHSFVFSSTCSTYGVADTSKLATEEDSVNAVSSYADTKIRAEKYLLSLKGKNGFSPIILRLATVYGISNRMRFDLLINEMVRDAWLNHKLEIFAGNAWRPMVHVQDVADVVVRVLEKNPESLAGEIVNVGRNDFNVQKMALAKMIGEIVGDVSVTIASETSDPRNYRVSFDKMERLLDLRASRSPRDGILEILEALKKETFGDSYDSRYKNRGAPMNLLAGTFESPHS